MPRPTEAAPSVNSTVQALVIKHGLAYDATYLLMREAFALAGMPLVGEDPQAPGEADLPEAQKSAFAAALSELRAGG